MGLLLDALASKICKKNDTLLNVKNCNMMLQIRIQTDVIKQSNWRPHQHLHEQIVGCVGYSTSTQSTFSDLLVTLSEVS